VNHLLLPGKPLEAYIFMGPVYYQKLKHMLINNLSYVEAETYAHSTIQYRVPASAWPWSSCCNSCAADQYSADPLLSSTNLPLSLIILLGEPLEAYIFTGPVYYQKLKHMLINNMSVC
jgi:hypothetical protein